MSHHNSLIALTLASCLYTGTGNATYGMAKVTARGVVVTGSGNTLSSVAADVADGNKFGYDSEAKTAICSATLLVEGELAIRDETLKFNCSRLGEYLLVVGSGRTGSRGAGATVIIEGSTVTSASQRCPFGFVVRQGTKFVMRRSRLFGCGWADKNGQRGFRIEADLAVVEKCTIKAPDFDYVRALTLSAVRGCRVVDCELSVYGKEKNYLGGQFYMNDSYAVCLEGCSECTIAGNKISVTHVTNAGTNPERGGLTHVLGILHSRSNRIEDNELFTPNIKSYGVYLIDSRGNVLARNQIRALHSFSIMVRPSQNPTVYDNEIEDTNRGLGGRRIYYFYGRCGLVLQRPPEPALIFIAASNHVKVKDVNMEDAEGVCFAHVNNSAILDYKNFRHKRQEVQAGYALVQAAAVYPIWLYRSSCNQIQNVEIRGGGRHNYGVYLDYGSDYNTIENVRYVARVVAYEGDGHNHAVDVRGSHNVIENVRYDDSTWSAILAELYGGDNTLKNCVSVSGNIHVHSSGNRIVGNTTRIGGGSGGYYGCGTLLFGGASRNVIMHNRLDGVIDLIPGTANLAQVMEDNLIGGERLVFLQEKEGVTIEDRDDIGQLILANCRHVTLRNLTMDKGPVIFANTRDCTMSHCRITTAPAYGEAGLYLQNGSSRNVILDCTVRCGHARGVSVCIRKGCSENKFVRCDLAGSVKGRFDIDEDCTNNTLDGSVMQGRVK